MAASSSRRTLAKPITTACRVARHAAPFQQRASVGHVQIDALLPLTLDLPLDRRLTFEDLLGVIQQSVVGGQRFEIRERAPTSLGITLKIAFVAGVAETARIATSTASSNRRESMTSAKAPDGRVNRNSGRLTAT